MSQDSPAPELLGQRREPATLLARMLSLLDPASRPGAHASADERFQAALRLVLEELGAEQTCLYLREDEGPDRLAASQGFRSLPPERAELGPFGSEPVVRASGDRAALFERLSADVLCPIARGGRVLGLLALGPRRDGRPYAPEDMALIQGVAACAAVVLESGAAQDELRRLNERLSSKVIQLRNLFDVGRELTASLEEEGIAARVTTTLMGHLFVSRCALYVRGPEGLRLLHERGSLGREGSGAVRGPEADRVLAALASARTARELPAGELRDRLERSRMTMVAPLLGPDGPAGLMAAGERASGAPFTDDDREFAEALGRQAFAALEAARLHRVALEKERQDRELQIAQEIQRRLLPRRLPPAPGFDLAGASEPCYAVGGDHYDVIALPDGRLALAVADVSGKGTPASLLMASVHASLRALAGTAPPEIILERLNRFLFESTRPGRYVTLFYAELEPSARRLRCVTAGHVPPFWLRGGRHRERLPIGGPAVGLLEDATFPLHEVRIEPGDVLAVVTDGATEAASPSDEEFGDERVFAILEAQASRPASDLLSGLLDAVRSWCAPARCADDLTALVLKAVPD